MGLAGDAVTDTDVVARPECDAMTDEDEGDATEPERGGKEEDVTEMVRDDETGVAVTVVDGTWLETRLERL